MSAQDNLERVLRDLHVMVSQAEIYERDDDKIILDKDRLIGMLKTMNRCIYAMMEEYEMTQESRDQAEREFQHRADEIVTDANRKAEDIYAASVMYTNEALGNVQEIMNTTAESVHRAYENMMEQLEQERLTVRKNQTELLSELSDLRDAEKYKRLIDDRNQEIQKEKEKEQRLRMKQEAARYADRQAPIKVDTEVLQQMGYMQSEQEAENAGQSQTISRQPRTVGQQQQKAGRQPQMTAPIDLGIDDEDEADDTATYANRQTEVKVDTEMLRKLGIQNPARADDFHVMDLDPRRDETDDSDALPDDELIQLDLDEDYFKWKEEQDAEFNANAARDAKKRGRRK